MVFTDVERSTELYNVRGDDEASAVVEAHARIVREQVSRHGGWEVKALGDGFMLAFASVRAAVACAIDIQRANERDGQTHPHQRVGVRVGINTGDVTRRESDLFGQAVNAAARIASCADPDEILVSRVVKDLAGTVPGVVFVDRGASTLKGFPEPWPLYRVDWREPAGASPLVVRLLGDPEVRAGATVVEAVMSPRLLSLLAYVILHSDTAVARQRLAFKFWPDSSEAQARTNLRQALHNIRHAIPEPDRFLRVEAQTVQWIPDAPAEIDAIQFDHAARTGLEPPLDRVLLERAASLYMGDLLPGCYDDWVEPERDRLRKLYITVLEQLTALIDERGDTTASLRFAEQLVQADPLHEASYRRLMRLHMRTGERARALRVYHACASALDRELGVSPSSETVALYESLIGDEAPDRGSAVREHHVASALIGREAESERLVASWCRAAVGRAQFVVVTGEAGIGKSRLVDDFRSWCDRQRLATAAARAYEAEGSLPYAPLIDVLRSNDLRPTLSRLDDIWLTEVARLLPELLVGQSGVTRAVGGGMSSDRSVLFEALARAILHTGRPLVIVIEDLQWCDVETLEFLHFLARFAANEALLVVGTVRDEAVTDTHPLRALLGGLRAIDVVEEVPLRRLSEVHATALARVLAGADAEDQSIRRLVEESEGNPLFLVEMARGGVETWRTTDATTSRPLPPRVQTVIEARLDRLPRQARDLANVAAVVGRAFTMDVLIQLVPDDDAVVAAIDELWHRGVVHERGIDSYDFSHDKIREVAYASIGPARRRRLHLDVARVLERVHADGLDAVAGQIAVHYDRAGDLDRALEFYERAIDAARHLYAHDEVIALCTRGLELIALQPEGPERSDRELRLLVPLGVAYYAGPGINYAGVFERAMELRVERGLLPDVSTLRLTANAAIVRRDYPEAHRLGEVLLARGEAADDVVQRTEGHYVCGVSSFWMGRYDQSRDELQRSLEVYDPKRAVEHLEWFGQDPKSVCLVRLGITQWHLGEIDAARALCDEAVEYARGLGHPGNEGYVRVFAAWAAAEGGFAERAGEIVGGVGEAGRSANWSDFLCHLFTAWAQFRRGDADGLRALKAAATTEEGRMPMFEPLALLYLARGLRDAGDPTVGLRVAEEARVIAEREIQCHESDASRLCGELLAACGGDPGEIETALRRAVTVALDQHSPVLELRSRTSLVRWCEAGDHRVSPADLRRLDELRARFPGFPSTD